MATESCKLIGRWRIIEADMWDRDYLDLCGPAMMTITDEGRGEIAFGAVQASLDVKYRRELIRFAWEGWDEGDQVSGAGSAELNDDGSIEIEFVIHNGDEAVLKAKRADQGRRTFKTPSAAPEFMIEGAGALYIAPTPPSRRSGLRRRSRKRGRSRSLPRSLGSAPGGPD